MAVCTNCGASNAEGTKFCVTCGATLGDAPAPESWRASGNLDADAGANADTTGPAGTSSTGYASDAGASSSSYTPGASAGGYTPPPPSSYPSYTPTQSPQSYQPQGTAGGAQPMHPAIPAIISLFLPGIGLLFVPDKQKLGLMVFGGYIVLWFICFLLTFLVIGACLFLLFPLLHIAAAIQSWDEAAKSSGGQFQPLLFK